MGDPATRAQRAHAARFRDCATLIVVNDTRSVPRQRVKVP